MFFCRVRFLGTLHIGSHTIALNLYDRFQHSHLLFINELEMRRATERGTTIYGDSDYNITVHYSLLTREGEVVSGGKVTELVGQDKISLRELTHSTFKVLAKKIISEAYVYLGTTEQPVEESVIQDY